MTILLALTYAKQAYRLPPNVIPEHYTLGIITHLGPAEDNFKFLGDVKIDVSIIMNIKLSRCVLYFIS